MLALYLNPFLTAWALSAGISFLLLRTKKNIPRFGGVALIAAFFLALALNQSLVMTPQLWAMITGAGMILAVGLVDDVWKLSWRWQLLFQISIAVLVFGLGVQLESLSNPFGGAWWLHPEISLWPSLFFSVFWMVLLMNALNWTDGIDGLLGSVALIASLVIFGLSLLPQVDQPPVGIMALILAGATLGFLMFNFPPARLLAGTSGSLFLGFMLAALSIFAGTKMATALLVLALPIADTLWVIGERFREGVSIFHGDARHLHYKLRSLGWSDRKIVSFYALVTTLIGIAALNTRHFGKLLTLVLVFCGVFSVLWWVERQVKRIAL